MDKTFKEIIAEASEQRGLELNKLASQSRIPRRYLELMFRGEFNSLPPAPYLHGYITRLADILELDQELLWEIYKKENKLKIAGSEDHLPINRFALQTVSNTKILVIGALLLTAILYVILRFNALFGRPGLTITDPAADTTITNESTYTIHGSADPAAKVTVNNDLVNSNQDGTFSKNVLLEEGLNTFSIKASKFLGSETSLLRQIILETSSQPTSEIPFAPPSSLTPTSTAPNQ